MDNPLTPEVERRIRVLCGEIAVAYDVDDDLREELRGHIEDKVRGYLSGEIPVSEDDAFMLAREHFGDRQHLRELLNEVHQVEADAYLWRRIMAGFILVLGVTYAWLMFQAALEWTGIRLGLLSTHSETSWGPRTYLAILGATLVTAAIWYVFRRWKSALERGERLWFTRWHPDVLVYCVVGVLLTCPLSELIQQAAAPESFGHGPWFLAPPPMISIFLPFGFVLAILWMWWCDAGLRRARTLGAAAFSWMIIMWHYFPLGCPNFLVQAPIPPGFGGMSLLSIGEVQWVWVPSIIVDSLGMLLILGGCAFAEMVAYEGALRLWRHVRVRVEIVEA